jgi:hypothetical protein
VDVRISVARPVAEVWQLACDPMAWPPMPGAPFELQLSQAELSEMDLPRRVAYAITAGLPVREHRGELVLTPTPSGGTELAFGESFRPRIWGTGGYLRGRRERALVDTARAWERALP